MADNKKVFEIHFQDQKNDGIVESSDMVAYLRSIMKVRNSKVIAAKALSFKDNTSMVEVHCEKDDVLKKNMKLYVKRYLRTKSLYPYVKVAGGEDMKITLKYRNPVVDEE